MWAAMRRVMDGAGWPACPFHNLPAASLAPRFDLREGLLEAARKHRVVLAHRACRRAGRARPAQASGPGSAPLAAGERTAPVQMPLGTSVASATASWATGPWSAVTVTVTGALSTTDLRPAHRPPVHLLVDRCQRRGPAVAPHRRGRRHRGEDRHRPEPSRLRTGSSMNPNGRQGKGSPSVIRPSEVHERRADRVSAGQRLGAPAGIEPATSSLPWNHREPLCGRPFSQVAPDRRCRS